MKITDEISIHEWVTNCRQHCIENCDRDCQQLDMKISSFDINFIVTRFYDNMHNCVFPVHNIIIAGEHNNIALLGKVLKEGHN